MRDSIPVVLFLILLLLSVFVIRPFIIAILLGAFLAYLLHPVHRILAKRMKSRVFPPLILCLLVLFILIVPGVFLAESLIKESYTSYIVVKQKLAIGFFRDCDNTFCYALREFSQNPDIQSQIKEITKAVTTWVVEKSSSLLVSLPKMILNLVVLFYTLYYFLKDGPRLLRDLNTYLGLRQKKYQLILGRLGEILHGVVYGYLLIAVMQGALGALGFFLFGISSPLFWGMIMGFFALVPFIGTAAVWFPAALLLFLEGLFVDSNSLMLKAVGLFIYGSVVISGLDNFIRPKLMGEKARIHPVVILLGIFGGVIAFGTFGVILGPLVLSLAVVILEAYIEKH